MGEDFNTLKIQIIASIYFMVSMIAVAIINSYNEFLAVGAWICMLVFWVAMPKWFSKLVRKVWRLK